jgi:electron transfer flavoprotein alpha subunit
MSVLIFTEAVNGKIKKSSLEAVTYGAKIATQIGSSAVALNLNPGGADVSELGKYGANRVIVGKNPSLSAFDSQVYTAAIAEVAASVGATVIITVNDSTGKAVAPRLSARLKAGLVAGATTLPNTDSGFAITKNVFSGKAKAHYNIVSAAKVISLMPNAIQPNITGSNVAIEEVNLTIGVTAKTQIKEVKRASTDKVALPEAELVVSAGRGLKGPENWGIIEDLANSIGAATACSRPVADIGWRPHHEHVGQTGVAIRPNLYIAVGISGAIQHLAGVNQSKTIVVINKDPEAPFFKAADYGVVGDAFEIVPKLTAAFQKFKAGHN